MGHFHKVMAPLIVMMIMMIGEVVVAWMMMMKKKMLKWRLKHRGDYQEMPLYMDTDDLPPMVVRSFRAFKIPKLIMRGMHDLPALCDPLHPGNRGCRRGRATILPSVRI
jgi:hypothetical protein